MIVEGELHECPRRAEGPSLHPGPDRWGYVPGAGGQDGELSCSYCGSLAPDRFLDLVRAGWFVGPTDKPYKANLHRPLSDNELAERKATWMRGMFADVIRATFAPADLNGELERAWEQEHAACAHTAMVGKMYFQHLSYEQQRVFIALYNDGVMQIGYPGRFHQLPFFCVPNVTEEGSEDGVPGGS